MSLVHKYMGKQAIPLVYYGIKFRSRLEARWAMFFDAIGVDWEYEPVRLELSTRHYKPDFKIRVRPGLVWPDIDSMAESQGGTQIALVEVKPGDLTLRDFGKVTQDLNEPARFGSILLLAGQPSWCEVWISVARGLGWAQLPAPKDCFQQIVFDRLSEQFNSLKDEYDDLKPRRRRG